MEDELNIAFVGNPNCGKTTLFNAYTGAKLKVANWPGVTVEKKEGVFKYHNHKFKLVDLPGIYSLTSYTMEEKVSRNYIMGKEVDVVINIVDASCLERNLYLTLQLIELGKPVILALNMMDIVEERGMEIDLHRLPEMLGIPVIPVSARKKTGLEILMHTVAHHKEKINDLHFQHHHHHKEGEDKISHHIHSHHDEYAVVYSDPIEDKIDEIIQVLKSAYPDMINYRWHALKLLEKDEQIQAQYPIDTSSIIEKSYEKDIINQKYDFIEEVVEEVVINKEKKVQSTDKMDHFFTHPILGLPIFLCIMALVFFLTFTIGDFLKGGFENVLEAFSNSFKNILLSIGVNSIVISLIIDGIIAGVGGILTFLPNIFILFLSLAFLEDSGYMARVAYVMDTIMGKIGLSGKAFIPMLLGFGCTVPAIMASRALEDKKDRLKTILVTPFMSCSAKLPIYVLFSSMFFGKYAMFAAFSMYIIGLLVGILIARIIHIFEKKEILHPLLIELPEYKSPNPRTIFIYVWDKIKDYLTKAGTTIFIASIVLWFILNFNIYGMTDQIQESFAASFGKFLVPILMPAGLGLWQVVVALISGLAAKEVVVSSFAVLFQISNINSATGMNSLIKILEAQNFTALNAYAMMIFCLLYPPCVAALATIYRELKSIKWTFFSILFQFFVAWIITVLFYQTANLFF